MEMNANDNLTRVSDGKLYDLNDMVKVGCHDCKGCSLCCQDMGNSIILDPYDVYRLTENLNQSFEQLLASYVEFHVEDGLILPNLQMKEHAQSTPACVFLNEEGRCSVHEFRPGLCRIFPLGRNYDEDRLQYFLLLDECPAENKTKMKVSKWIDTPQLKENQEFLVAWHGLIKRIRSIIRQHASEDDFVKQINMVILQIFYMTPYTTEDFYTEFDQRLEKAQNFLKGLEK